MSYSLYSHGLTWMIIPISLYLCVCLSACVCQSVCVFVGVYVYHTQNIIINSNQNSELLKFKGVNADMELEVYININVNSCIIYIEHSCVLTNKTRTFARTVDGVLQVTWTK